MTDHADTEDVGADALDAEQGIITPPGRLNQYRKFIIAAVGIAVTVGVLDPSLEQDLVGLLTAALVLLIPNE
jgi:hypothetical protein